MLCTEQFVSPPRKCFTAERLLGPEKAFYFLHPSTVDKPVSLRVRHLLEAGIGIWPWFSNAALLCLVELNFIPTPCPIDMGAEELWRALHEEPKHQRQIAEAKKGRSLSQQVPWLGCPASTHRMQQVAHWRQQLHTMHRLGKQHQHTASRLLATKHLTELSDVYGTEGPTRYLHCALDQKQAPVTGGLRERQ
ncbi:uncharacterized protein LOC128347073 isoform X2 [Hemicordylus capensis]|uniref:uncharacterized protein LOC128347073 isoform X2 n=1 Tax=Hemicordylus capensis TaxID=884348 RepID=UPI0023035C25|nr:uncharacterized protein LOC128347073 isoform X2 [Hemicordylus capensis]XP_053157123.1 uncharacterized protein LOC128347073 isoform X2 [Hemicordylus capensis]XP_053157124.1 uncharacterized protein LOC128347073 isoform X2 [Hemicordylus capensis]XP_053157125.1 uncharacterized protein LOC128347073 isoform X2 [Hemicordylus capensis]XP_053157126.1 uncharacterized protein LOC128347073 isoform X2 [Hemicordylus capensis]